MSDGTFFGTLCAVDPEPKQLTQHQVYLLTVLTRIIATSLERDHELSRRQDAQRQLRRQLDYNTAINSSLLSGLFAVDEQYCVTFMNPAAESMLGWTEAELLGKHMHEMIHYQHADGTPFLEKDCPMRGALSGRRVHRDEDVFTRKDGTIFSVGYTSQPIFDAGHIMGAVVSFRDLTEVKKTEEISSFLASIVESSDDAILSKSLEGIITSWNRGAQKLYGYSPEEVIGKSVSILVPPENPTEIPKILEALRRGETLNHFETVRVKKDGGRIHISVNISPILDSHGKIIGASTIARDITERKLIEKLRHENEELFRSSFEDAATGVALVAPDGRWIRVNHALCEILGYSEQELLHPTFLEATHPDDREAILDHVRQVLAGERHTFQTQKRYFHKDGHEVWVQLNASLIRDGEDNPLYFVCQIQDISELKELEEMKVRFVSSVSHELRTPLTSIEGYLDALLEDEAGPLNEEQREYAEIAYRNAERLKMLVGDLLMLSRIESGKLEIRFEAVDMGESVRSVKQELLPLAESKGIPISVSAEPDLMVSGERLRLTQVLSNLVSNAIKFTPSRCSVALRAYRSGREVIVEVADQGVGIPAAELPRLTDRFFRASTAGTIQGTGLGLAIVKEIVERHGGRLEIESEEGAGSTFRVVLPLAT